jgi:MYXO-CTERM domain-containing protein
MFPAAIRYFAVESGTTAVVLGGAEAANIDVIAVAFDGTTFSARANGRGGVTLDAPGAELTFVALVDGRATGMSRVVSLCFASSAEECSAPGDAGVGDAGLLVDDAGTSGGDAGAMPMASSGCGCRVGRGSDHAGERAGVGLLAALGLVLAWRRRRS